ncbi:uncharacterized protein N7525_001945 [Penicillium rubens]|uniref:uncharacterized protein n=1 Tax=Penicillium rubens TaxID=1108849 RepID=UPI002A59A169|nr:uncharacterized protein N7525_001945 [Penicillium rubens]KAJ5844204.1 hypothetical protein N7525_001945 [Penicillium rubens]
MFGLGNMLPRWINPANGSSREITTQFTTDGRKIRRSTELEQSQERSITVLRNRTLEMLKVRRIFAGVGMRGVP